MLSAENFDRNFDFSKTLGGVVSSGSSLISKTNKFKLVNVKVAFDHLEQHHWVARTDEFSLKLPALKNTYSP